jgi:putative NIF3 family GTP cyclohydrolase 1 type 2
MRLTGCNLRISGHVTKIGAAVDAGEPTFRKAAEAGIDLLLVHHGLFWTGLRAANGRTFPQRPLAIRADMAVYSAHLPLDVHPSLGNNALLAEALAFKEYGAVLL